MEAVTAPEGASGPMLKVKEASPADAEEPQTSPRQGASGPIPQLLAPLEEQPKIWLPRALRQTYIRKVGDTVNLRIPFQGKPKPRATWTHNSCALDASRVSVRNGEQDSILFIREAQRADSGRYQLSVQLGGLEATATIDILVIERPGPPQSIKLVDVWDSNATLEWTPPQDTGNAALLGYTVQKADTKSGLWFTVLERYHRTSFTVSNLIIGNSYAFRVFAENQCGLSETAPITADLAHIQKAVTVYKTKGFAQRDFSEAPKFTQPLVNCTTVTGYDTQLFCCVRASPKPKIVWLKNNMDIQGNPKYRALTHLGICSLEIRKPGPFDGGIYTCKAVNPLGEASVDCRVDVTNVKFIVDETLDFGGLSPSDSREEEDIPVLATPEKPLRRGLSHRGDLNAVAPTPQGVSFSLGLLSPAKMEEVLDEANRLAAQLEQCALQERERAGESPGPRRAKPSPRRETFVLKDSPVRDLLPTVSSSARSTPSPSSLTPRLRGSDRKGSVRALRAASGKKPSSVKRESPTCNLFPTSKSPASSPLARSTPPDTYHLPSQTGPSGRATASERTQGAKLGVNGKREDVELTLARQSPSDRSWPHSLLPATVSACLGHREQLLNLPVDYLSPQPSPSLSAECHSAAGVYHPAEVPSLQIRCQLVKDFQDQVLQGTEFLFPSDQIFLVPLAAICSPPGKLQPQDLPGKEIRTVSKNSVTNHDSPCLDSPPLRPPKPSRWRQFRTPADSGSGARGRDATTAGAQGDGVD
ncbi:Myosin-binding protein H-like protein [Myotis davidii]|uniref:Myosin-binding protein H-like n=1 Tax=Myotis davidii TaxID=225400 RepID=L5LXB6_MYODS|nr:Myosin-binding protein H-like protein [Myotis davidii]